MVSAILVSPMHAQSDDTGFGISVSADHKLAKGVKLQLEAEVRSQDGLGMFERWAFDVGLNYRLLSWLKADAGYAIMDRYHPSEQSSKGNCISGYWAPRHRWYASLSAQQEWGRLKVSLRERYQLTHSPLQYVPKYLGTHCDCAVDHYGQRLTDEVKGGQQDHMLRSRLQASYNIRHCPFTPEASIEVINDVANGFDVDQIRYSIGVDYSISKRRSLSLQWRYKDRADLEEANGHLFTLGYNFTF